MTTLVSAELFKLRTTRAPWTVAIALGALAAAVLVLSAALSGTPGQPALEPSVLGDLARASGRLTGAAALLLGLLLSTAEYRHGTALTTRLGHPRVPGLVLAKATAAALAGLALALAVELVMVGGGAVMLAYRGVSVEPLQHGVPAAVASVTVVAALHAVAGVAIGELLRNPALAVGVVFGWAFLVEGVLPLVLRAPQLGRWLPTGTARSALALGWTHDGALLVPWAGLLMLAAYAIGLLLAGLGRSTLTDP
jgi:ABC-2 type transport system permease protein